MKVVRFTRPDPSVPRPERDAVAASAAGTFRAAAFFLAPIAVAGMVAVVPIAAGLAVAGVAIALPASYTASLRRHLATQGER